MFKLVSFFFTINCMITSVIISIIALTFAVHSALSRRSFLYIDINTATYIIQLKLFCLPDASRSCSVKLPRQCTQLAFRSYFLFGVIAFISPSWTLSHSLTQKHIKLPRILLIPARKLSKLHEIFESNNYVANPLIVHTHEYAYVNASAGKEEPNKSSCPPYEGQYV
jgi:hypothetical protein